MVIQERLGLGLDLAYSLDCAGIMALLQDDHAAALRLLERALELREQLNVNAAPSSARRGMTAEGCHRLHTEAGEYERLATLFDTKRMVAPAPG